MASRELHCCHIPLTQEVLQGSCVTSDTVQPNSTMAQGGRRSNTPKIPVFALLTFFSIPKFHGGILSHARGGFRPMASPLNPPMALIITYEYLFCLPSSERLRSPIGRKARGLLSGSCTPGTTGHQLWPINQDMIGFVQWQMVGEHYTPYQM
jgi:hypothetical protein